MHGKQGKRIIIGIVGHPLSGKDTAAEYLVEKFGFTFISTGDMIREYVRKNDLGETTRENLSRVGSILRKERGGDFLIQKALENPAHRIILGGIRAVPEAKATKSAGGIIIAIDAPLKTRYERAKERKRIGDDVTFEEFCAIEEKESASTDRNAQNVNAVIALADITVDNGGDVESLKQRVSDAIRPLLP